MQNMKAAIVLGGAGFSTLPYATLSRDTPRRFVPNTVVTSPPCSSIPKRAQADALRSDGVNSFAWAWSLRLNDEQTRSLNAHHLASRINSPMVTSYEPEEILTLSDSLRNSMEAVRSELK